jgi:hypothetical protein
MKTDSSFQPKTVTASAPKEKVGNNLAETMYHDIRKDTNSITKITEPTITERDA